MSDLSQDELTVLMLAAKGESMIPIGRWEKPIKNLAAKGYLHAHDASNYVLTDLGRLQLDDGQDDEARQIIEITGKIASAQSEIQKHVEEAARHLSFAAKASARLTGHAAEDAGKQWADATVKRMLEILKDE